MDYDSKKKIHFDLCATYDVSAKNTFGAFSAQHSGIEILITAKSPHIMKLRGQTEILCPGEVMIYNGQEEHTEIYHGGNQLQALVLYPRMLFSAIPELAADFNQIEFKNHKFRLQEELKNNLLQFKALRNTPDISKFSFDCLSLDSLIHLLENYEHSESSKISRLKQGGYFPLTITKVKKAIYENLNNENFSLDDLARLVGMSKFHLVRNFKSKEGITPMRYRRLLQLDVAKNLLSSTPQTITSIAFSSGFCDLSTFNKAFKRKTHMSASNFKKTFQK